MYQGTLQKMRVKYDFPIEYSLQLGEHSIDMNMLIGTRIKITFLEEIHCIACGASTQTSYAQGYCYKCFSTLPETDECILKPELCKAHEGISRNMEWSEEHCLQAHYVYLALSSQVKVGVTRASQVPTRWIDQGAWKALKLAKTPNRFTAGLIEVDLKKHFSDKTSWQKMLKNELALEEELIKAKQKAQELLSPELQNFLIDDNQITEIEYPVLEYPTKISSVSLDNEKTVEGILQGIKGQYLIFDTAKVLNVRKHTGYKVQLAVL